MLFLILLVVVPFLVTIASFVFAGMAFLGYDVIISSVYHKLTDQQREQVDKTPFTMQATIIFFAIGLVSMCGGLYALLHMWMFTYMAIALICGAIVYFIISERKLKAQIPPQLPDPEEPQETE